jgi:thymidylate kinase
MERLEVVKAHIAYYLERHDRLTVAIEGSCTAGKTTLAGALAEVFDCNVFHMDDFFLRPEPRTAERFAQPGGNVDRERFLEEVLLPQRQGKQVVYRPFDCGSQQLGEP